MTATHLRTFLWLRWRMFVNQVRRSGITNTVLMTILAVAAVLLVIGLFAGAFLIGAWPMQWASPSVVGYVWNGLVALFLFAWCIGLIADLQRSESLTLTRFLHLPIPLSSAFFVNYLSSYFSLTLLFSVPTLAGLALGLVISQGAAMLLLLPLILALFFLVTAVTYQLQGWLEQLMSNKRRRRRVVVVATVGVIAMAQLPNLLNVYQPWKSDHHQEFQAQFEQEKRDLDAALQQGKISTEQHGLAKEAARVRFEDRSAATFDQLVARVDRTLLVVDLLVPPGWLPLAAKYLAQANVLPALLATAGLTLLGSLSLWLSYRATLRHYLGQGQRRVRLAKKPAAVTTGKASANPLDKDLPWLSEPASAVALAMVRTLVRSPEAKMALVLPFIIIFLAWIFTYVQGVNVPVLFRPSVVAGAIVAVIIALFQLLGNMFGMERNGFRVFVLSPMDRRDVLLGKNLAVAPFGIGFAVLVLIVLQILQPMPWAFVVTSLLLMVATYFLYCLFSNWISILAPMRMAPGSMRNTNVKITAVLIQFGLLMLFSILVLPLLLPTGVGMLLYWLEVPYGPLVTIPLALLVCAGSLVLYRVLLPTQGQLLHNREQTILDVVTNKSE